MYARRARQLPACVFTPCSLTSSHNRRRRSTLPLRRRRVPQRWVVACFNVVCSRPGPHNKLHPLSPLLLPSSIPPYFPFFLVICTGLQGRRRCHHKHAQQPGWRDHTQSPAHCLQSDGIPYGTCPDGQNRSGLLGMIQQHGSLASPACSLLSSSHTHYLVPFGTCSSAGDGANVEVVDGGESAAGTVNSECVCGGGGGGG